MKRLTLIVVLALCFSLSPVFVLADEMQDLKLENLEVRILNLKQLVANRDQQVQTQEAAKEKAKTEIARADAEISRLNTERNYIIRDLRTVLVNEFIPFLQALDDATLVELSKKYQNRPDELSYVVQEQDRREQELLEKKKAAGEKAPKK